MKQLHGILAAMVMLITPAAHADIVQPTAKPKVEVVFVLDTTGSMSGLIQAAKDKIWSIANTLANTNPAPEVKMGLVAYRDRGDAYVTKRTDLNTDLDAVYKELMQYSADGGGDGPESVNQALSEAINSFTWSQDPKTYRVIFLVGDAPPHMDYQDDKKYQDSVKAAVAKGIVVNAIQCGGDAGTTPIWNEIAKLGEGQYFSVEQSGGAIVATTPFDGKLATLAKELDNTRIYYGSKGEQEAQRSRESISGSIYSSASSSAQAQRATYNASPAGKANFASGKELINDLEDRKVSLENVPSADLPADLQGLSAPEKAKVVEEKQTARRKLQAEISRLSAQRQEYIASKTAEGAKKDSLDQKVYEAIKVQGGRKSIAYDKGPLY